MLVAANTVELPVKLPFFLFYSESNGRTGSTVTEPILVITCKRTREKKKHVDHNINMKLRSIVIMAEIIYKMKLKTETLFNPENKNIEERNKVNHDLQR